MRPTRLLAAATLASGCAGSGASARITAHAAHFPVSLTATVLDRSLRPVPRGDLVRVGALSVDRAVCGGDGALDLSRAVDDAVRAAGAEAVVNVRAEATRSADGDAGCARVRVFGDVVRRRYGAVPVPELTRGCAEGRPDLCVGLAGRLLAGDGLPRDGAQAVAALERGCVRGSAWSCAGLSTLLADGQAAPPDLPRAMRAADTACRADLAEACVAMASLLAREDNPARDATRAREIAERQCQRGSMHGCHVLAEIVASVPEGASRARQLFERACIGGFRPACARRAPPSGGATGLLSPEAIRAVVMQNLGQVRACHEAALARDASAHGRVVVRFVIGGDGAVRAAGVAEAAAPLGDAGACIVQAMRAWRFPAPQGGGVVTVNYPFNLLERDDPR